MTKCKLSGHITRPCDISGAGGMRNLYAISAEYVVGYTKQNCEVVDLTLRTIPTPELFWKIDLFDQTSSFISDPSTDADAGAFYLQTQATVRIAKTAKNRCILSKLLGDRIVLLAEFNDGTYSIAGLTGRGKLASGMRFVQMSEGTFASGDLSARKSDLLVFRHEGRITDGILEFQRPIPNHNILNVYAVGDVVYDNVNDCYFQAKNAGTLSALPACDNSNADWASITEYEAKRYVNEIFIQPLVNP